MLAAENRLLREPREELLAFALEHCPVDPTFGPFVRWARERGLPVTLVSDGYAFYIAPLLERAGLGDVEVITNVQLFDDRGRPDALAYPNANADGCTGCGTCKMQAVQRARETRGPVVFIGEGVTDRYAALYADVVFAKDELPAVCLEAGVEYREWTDFDDVVRSLETGEPFPGPLSPVRCPGWTLN